MRAPLRCPWRLLLVLLVLLCAGMPFQPSVARVLHAFGTDVHALPRDRELADLVAAQSLDSGPRSDPALFLSLDLDAESHDIIARVGGRGRSRSDGISITRAMRRDHRGDYIGDADNADNTNGRALFFTPVELDIGRVHACTPTSFKVRVQSRSALPLRIDDVRFESDAFLLGSDPRGVMLDPGESVDVILLFVVGEPQPFHSFIFFVTSVGEFAVPVRGHTLPSPYGLTGLRVTVPVGARVEHTISLRNPSDKILRVSEIFSLDSVGNILLPIVEHPHPITRMPSEPPDPAHAQAPSNLATVWEIPPLATKPVARFTFKADGPTGRHISVVRVATTAAQFFVPFQIDVQQDLFIIEPSDIDVGVFTSEREERHVLLTLHNTGPRPIAIREVRAVEIDGLNIAADLLGDFPVIPARSRVQHAVHLVLQDGHTKYRSGRCSLLLEIKSNASSSDTTHNVQVRAFTMRGHISYSLAQTMYRVVGPTTNVSAGIDHSTVEMGTKASRALILKNEFDVPLELERIQLPESCEIFTFEGFDSRIVAPASDFPPIQVHVQPSSTWPIATRVCSLQVETNASVHHVPIVLYSGRLRVTSSRNTSERATPSDSCSPDIQEGGVAGEDWTDELLLPRPGSKLCRQIVMDLGRLSKLATIEDVINVTNINPIVVQPHVRLTSYVPDNPKQPVEVDTTMSFHLDPHVALELAALGSAWGRGGHDKSSSSKKQQISLLPGRTLSLRMRIKVTTKRIGIFIEPIATIETELETIHVFIRFETARGAITPNAHTIELPYIHPGRLGFVDVAFISTMQHDVGVRGLELSPSDGHERPSALGLWNVPTVFRANSTTRVTLFYFPPEFYFSCQQGRFYADCFTRDNPARSPFAAKLSDFGSLVTQSDLERLAARQREWQPRRAIHGDDLGRRVGITATLSTDAMRVHPVRLTVHLVRPQFFHSGVSDQTIAFPLTEVLHHFEAYLIVTNPSDYAIDMELAIAEEDRELFYACDDDLNEDECLHEWGDIARERVQQAKKSKAEGAPLTKTDPPELAPLFVRPRVMHVPARDQIELGPIYFFPSSIGSWQTRVYIRNDLTHIEAVAITASSGLGELSIIPPLAPLSIAKQTRSSYPNSSTPKEINFLVEDPGKSNDSTVFQSTQTVELRNSGSFEFTFAVQLTNVTFSAFRIATDRGSITSDTNDSQFLNSMKLAPNETLSLAVEFSPDCIHSHFSSDLEIVTRDGITRYRVVGVLTPRASFRCRRQLFPQNVLDLTKWLWMVAVSTASVAVAVALLQLARAKTTMPEQPTASTPSLSNAGSTSRTAVTRNVEEQQAAEEMKALMRSLASLEETTTAAVESAVIVTTPHVAKLLASRAKTREKTQPGVGVADGTDLARHITAAGKVADAPKGTPPLKPQHQRQERETNRHSNQNTEGVMVQVLAQARSASHKTKDGGEHSHREDTASEDDEEEEDQVDNQADGETDGTAFSTPEEDDEENVVREGDLLMLNLEEPFVSISDLRLEDPLQAGNQELRLSLNFDDDWSALSFESLQSEIGKLVADDRAAFERMTRPSSSSLPSERRAIEHTHEHTVGGALASLSIAPPLLPMSSLFAYIGGTLLPPAPLPSAPKATKKAAPPGFTAADANPEASRGAFERLRGHNSLETSGPSLQSFPPAPGQDDAAIPPLEAAFSARYSLFGPTLGGTSFPTSTSTSSVSTVTTSGRIGSARPTKATTADGRGTAPVGGSRLARP